MSKLLVLAIVATFATLVGAPGPEKIKPVYGPTNPTPEQITQSKVQHFGSVVELRGEKEQYYRELHGNVWPEVLAAIHKANIRNYNIYVATIDGKRYLFSSFDYIGTDPKKDFVGIAKDVTTKNRWWPETDPCQKRLPGTPDGDQWLPMEMVMHID